MPDDQTDLTPQPGTADSQTPAGTDQGSAAAGNSEPDHPSDTTDYRTKFSESSREAQRLYAENMRLQGMLQAQSALYQQQQTAQQPAPAPTTSYGFEELLPDFADGVLNRDVSKVQPFAKAVIAQAKRELVTELAGEATKAARIKNSMDFINSTLTNNPTLTQASLQRYQQLASGDPTLYGIVNETTDIGGNKVNPHLLRLAVVEAQASLGKNASATLAQGQQSMDYHVNESKPAPPKKEGFNPSKHLFDWERDYCQRSNTPYDRYWKHMDPDLQEKRLSEGKPLRKVKGTYVG